MLQVIPISNLQIISFLFLADGRPAPLASREKLRRLKNKELAVSFYFCADFACYCHCIQSVNCLL